jgi:hypothetical protein
VGHGDGFCSTIERRARFRASLALLRELSQLGAKLKDNLGYALDVARTLVIDAFVQRAVQSGSLDFIQVVTTTHEHFVESNQLDFLAFRQICWLV